MGGAFSWLTAGSPPKGALTSKLEATQAALDFLLAGPIPVAALCEIVAEYAREFDGRNFATLKNSGRCGRVEGVAWIDASHIAVGARNGVNIWNVPTRTLVRQLHFSSERGCCCNLVLLCDGSKLAASIYNDVCVWDLHTGRCDFTIEFKEIAGDVFALAALGRDKLIAGTRNGDVTVWDLTTWKQMIKYERDFCRTISLVAISDTEFVSGENHGALYVWDSLRSLHSVKTLVGHTKAVDDMVLLCTDRLASCSWDLTIRVWDLVSAQCLHVFSSPGSAIVSLAALNSFLIATCTQWSDSVELWNIKTGKHVRTLHHTEHVRAIAACGGKLAVCQDVTEHNDWLGRYHDTTVCVWE